MSVGDDGKVGVAVQPPPEGRERAPTLQMGEVVATEEELDEVARQESVHVAIMRQASKLSEEVVALCEALLDAKSAMALQAAARGKLARADTKSRKEFAAAAEAAAEAQMELMAKEAREAEEKAEAALEASIRRMSIASGTAAKAKAEAVELLAAEEEVVQAVAREQSQMKQTAAGKSTAGRAGATYALGLTVCEDGMVRLEVAPYPLWSLDMLVANNGRVRLHVSPAN